MKFKKSISFVLTLCMVLSLFATFVIPVAAEEVPFEDGDNVVISYPKDGTAISTEVDYYESRDQYRLAATDLENGAVFTVDITENGTYFICDGKYLTSGATGSNLTLEAEANEYSLWEVEAAENGWYIKNVNAAYYDKPQYIEYFYAFTTYSLKEAQADIYTFQFIVQEKSVTSKVVTDWNPVSYKESVGGATGAFIYDDADVYANCGNYWWIHAAFAPSATVEGGYEVVALRPSSGDTVPFLTIPEGGFVWMAWSSAGDTPESSGAYALAFMSELAVGDVVFFKGVDFANKTTAADATAELWVDPNAPVNVALNKDYTLSGEENGTYNAKLTDGNAYGAMTYDNRWFAFTSANTVDKIGTVVVDLGALYDITAIQVNLVNDTGAGVAVPEYANLYVSEDGETWSEAIALTVSDANQVAYWAKAEELAVSAQYVKFEVKLGGTFAFLNEIEVYGALPAEPEAPEAGLAGANVSQWAAGAGFDVLTDGYNGVGEVNHYDPYQSKLFGVASGVMEATDYTLTFVVDEKDINTITLYALDFANGGVMLPDAVTFVVNGVEYEAVINANENGIATIVAELGETVTADTIVANVAMGASPYTFTIFNMYTEFETSLVEVEEDDESYKDTYTYVDGETVGTTQSRGDGWEALLVPDFWYVVEDGEATVTIKIAVDDRTVVEEDTMFRTWIDADLSDTARTTLVDVKVKDGAAYVARCDNELGAAVLSATYEVIGNDYFFVVELDKATLGIDGQYGLMLTLSETGYNSMHNVAWDVYDVAGCAPWNSTKDYIVYGEAPVVIVAGLAGANVSQWAAGAGFDVLTDGYNGVGEVNHYDPYQSKLFGVASGVMEATDYTLTFVVDEKDINTITLYALDFANGGVMLPDAVTFVVNGVEYEAVINANENGIATIVAELGETVTADTIVANVAMGASPYTFTIFNMYTEFETSLVEAPALNEVDGGELPAHNPRAGSLSIAANTAITYTVAFEYGANFNLWSEDVTVLVNGEALEMGMLGYVAVLAKGDTVTIVNAGAEAVEIYPSIAPVIPGTMSSPFVLDELGDITANVTEDIVMDNGAVFYTYTAPANGTLTITMPEGNWTYTVNNITAGLYSDTQWSDSDPVLSTYSIEVTAGDEIQIIVGTYNPDEPYTAPVGELTFNAAFEAVKVTSNVVTDWNTSNWGGADEAHIFTNQEAYLACTHTWWSHVSFKPTNYEGVYEVVAIRGATGEAAAYEIAEGGFIWLAHDTAAEGTAGAYAHALIKTLAVGDLVKFTGIDVANCTTTEDATAEKWEAPKAPDVVDLKVSHNNLYNWGTFESMIISQPGKTVVDVISQTPYWWIMYVVEEVDGVYVATAYYKNCDEINTTVCPENGFLYYVYSSNSAWEVADEGKLLGYIFNLNDIDLSANMAIDTNVNPGDVKYITALNPEALKAGDVNKNGEIDATDYAIIRKLVLGTLTAEDIGDLAYSLADVNGDGKVNARDYYLVKRAFLGTYVIPGWEVEEDEAE